MKHPVMQWVEGTALVQGRVSPPVGALVRINYRIREGEKERIQAFEGTVIRHHDGDGSMNATFTVRKMSQGFGVERVFPLHSPLIESITVQRQGRVRRAKLYFLRGREGKKARLREAAREFGPSAAPEQAQAAVPAPADAAPTRQASIDVLAKQVAKRHQPPRAMPLAARPISFFT